MLDYHDHKCCCNDKTRVAAKDMLQVCKTHELTVGETSEAIDHLKAHIAWLSLRSPVSVLHVPKEPDIK